MNFSPKNNIKENIKKLKEIYFNNEQHSFNRANEFNNSP